MLNKKIASAVALTLGLGIGSANATTVSQIFDIEGTATFEDSSAEWIGTDLNNNGLLDPGDTLQTVIEYPFVNGTPSNNTYLMDPLAGNNRLQAVSTIEVFSISGISGGFGDFVFAPVGSFAAGSILTGSMIDIYEGGNAYNPNNCGASAAQCVTNITSNGTLILQVGFTGDPDEAWESVDTPLNPNLRLFSTAINFGSFNYALNTVFSAIGDFAELQAVAPNLSTAGPNAFTEWGGGGSIKGALGTQPVSTLATDNSTLTATRAVPEPSFISLMGIGMLVAGGISRRRNKA